MHVSYQHANPFGARQSVLLRIEGLLPNQPVCILIDSGDEVEIDELLADDEYLTAICLTHAHIDHYRTLGANLRDGAPIYTSPDTAQILSDVFHAGSDYNDFENVDDVISALEPITGWTTIVDGLSVRPLPAGHTPGAVSLLFAIADGGTQRTLLATGDFTTRQTAAYPGFDPELPINVDVCLLSAATNDEFGPQVTEALTTIYNRANAGSTVLVTAGGLRGVHIATLLGQFASHHAREIPIRLVGQTAVLADQLDYDIPGVSTIPAFSDPAAMLDAGCVTVAGPDVPTSDPQTSAAQLFAAIDDDPAATLIQFPAGGGTPVQTAQCTVHEFSLSNHPSSATIDSVVESLEPIHVVILHATGAAAAEYKDKYESFVWATDDDKQYTLLDRSGWTPPPWVSDRVERRVSRNRIFSRQQFTDGVLTDGAGDLFPSIERQSTPDLSAEGVALARLKANIREHSRTHTPTSETPASSEAVDSSPVSNAVSEAELSTPDTTEMLSTIDERLARLEAQIDQPHYSARVLDVADGVTILRLDTTLTDVEPGDTVTVLPPR